MIGKRIKQLRESKMITQAALSKRTGININTLAAYERETREPNIEKISLIADFFQVSTDYLLGKSPDRNEDEAYESRERAGGIAALLLNIPPECKFKLMPELENYLEGNQNVVADEPHRLFLDSFTQVVRVYARIQNTFYNTCTKMRQKERRIDDVSVHGETSTESLHDGETSECEQTSEWQPNWDDDITYIKYRLSLADDCALIRAELEGLYKYLPLLSTWYPNEE